nr:immunoglobulin light chain junction region [Macaca mulatta]
DYYCSSYAVMNIFIF